MGDVAPCAGATRQGLDSRRHVQRSAREQREARGGGARCAGIRRQAVRPARADRADEADRPGLTAPDRHLERWFVHHRAGWLDPVFEGLSYAGGSGLLWLGIALVLAVVWRRWGVFALTLLAVAVPDLAARGLKGVIDVERPSS